VKNEEQDKEEEEASREINKSDSLNSNSKLSVLKGKEK
jgi:hypothetical protein